MRSPSASSSSSKNSKMECCSKVVGLKRGPWTAEEDKMLSEYVKREGEGRWRTMPQKAGLLRCGKSCRLRWMNYLRPTVKRGHISPDEEDLILRLHRLLGNRWSLIAGRIPGRTDNEIKNYWNTHLRKKLMRQGIDPKTHKPLQQNYSSVQQNSISLVQLISSSQNNIDHVQEGADGIKLDDDIDTYNFLQDDAFSSFFNSLINDDMFTNNQQQQQQQQQEQEKETTAGINP
ncbi:hypothetical protein RD792_005871 [Penstemon davidsonii]|uniref:Uncharacterized protein n=1 Tax=Penstemon davidsonii TaxID=160366 RepID=A0ABR0DE22_9LAMI|nr:hypothetical protein RD792_005871 [Penstemon davidsonii]